MMDDESIDLNQFDISMAPEAKVKTGIISAALGVVVGVVAYVLATQTTKGTVNAIKVLMNDQFDIQMREDDDG
jgi:hypothetical protein